MQVFWHRRDLRTTDNLGLAAAADAGDAVPVFCFDDAVLEHAAPPRVAFVLDALADLRERYRELGSDLVVRRGDASAVIPDVAREFDADRVVWNHDYSGLADERDEAVRAALDEQDTRHEAFHDAVLHRPGEIRTNAGDPYSVYTYFWKKWTDREKTDSAPEPDAEALADVAGDDLPSASDLGFEEPDGAIPEAGTEAARDRLESFCEDGIYRYADRRDYPADENTSRLSADLKFGTIGVREVYERTEDAMADADSEGARESVEEFQQQLAWREFYAQVLYFNQSVVTENFKDYENPIEWRDDPEGLQAWKDGETGYPIVDAGMRQLREEAFMHNRVRMIVAAFLTKDLLVDWREGYDWFRERLVDHDTANDNGGWQWAASTGTDAQPYFRIFNPTTQGERFDPDADYIKAYVPELRDVPADDIHDWPDLSLSERRSLAPDYPDPIVDHSERREEAIETFERARGDD
ncbi:cryptochrome/photolyase family protein [Halobacterium litoreum]|uniref:Cryptochrome/photolyase family protein n=1 Tax=Halobacterium litoreum TaxID=2039234 RepID=A0ABD5NBV6_9EURY|nr:deoxyribodipyrimidine photo-lyase [Halobacterium litoreum]UHH14573.1 DNA photolyase family protein [Halobacterium litoreum]